VGNVELSGADTATPKVTITGTVQPGTAPGTLVQNLVNVTSGVPDADPSDNIANNADLIPGGAPAHVRASVSAANAAPRSGWAARLVNPVPVLAAVLILAGLAAAARLIVVRRRHSRS
jgi:hypothetical protein